MKPQTQRNVAKVLIVATALTLAGCGGRHALQVPKDLFSKGKPQPEAPMKGKQKRAKKARQAPAPKPAQAAPQSPGQAPAIPSAASLPIEMPGTFPVAADQTSSAPVKAGTPVGGVKFQMPDFVKRALAWMKSVGARKAAAPAAATAPAPTAAKKQAAKARNVLFDVSGPGIVFGSAFAAILAAVIVLMAKIFGAQPKPKAVPTEPPVPDKPAPKGPKRRKA